jgi:hypothetical protein
MIALCCLENFQLATFLEPRVRALTERERRVVRAKIHSLGGRRQRARTAWIPIGSVVIGGLWAWTLLASDAPWAVITLFWLVVGGGIALWVRRDMRKHANRFVGMGAALESALVANVADVYDVRARAFAEIEEIEDEGACYAFEIEGPRLVFITGQEFYPGARFPSLDFSLVYVRDETGKTVDMLIEKRDARTKPSLTLPAAMTKELVRPEHLEVRSGTVETVRDVMSKVRR